MPATAYEIPHLTVEDFLGLPVRIGASISPDGTRIAYLAPWRNRLNVWVTGIGTGEQPRRVTAEALRSVRTYHWTDDPRWLLYEQDRDGDENWRIYRVDLENPDAEAVELTPFPGVRAMGLEMPVTWPGKAILRLNGRDPAEFDLYTLDIATGELTMLARNPGLVADLICTPDGYVCALALTADGDIELSQWDVGTGALRPVRTFDGADHPMGVRPFQLTPDGTGAWIGSSRGSDRTRLVRPDLTTGAETEVDSHPAHDLDTRSAVHPEVPYPLIIDRCTGDLIGVRYLGERQVIHPLDPHFAAVLENLEQLSDGDLAAVSSDVCGQRWVVSFTHDRAPGITYYYNHSTGESRMLFRPYPHLDPDFLAPMTPVTIPARDGLDLPSYLTLPVGTDPTGLPLVLLVHGGPWTRDGWGFHPVVQLLANRGYAVLQADFRGSTGHGKEINFATCQFSDKYLTFTVGQKTLGGRPNYYGATTCATTARGRSGSTTSITGTGTSPRENARSHSSPFTASSHVRTRRQQAGGPSHTFRLSRVAASTTTRGRHASPLFLSCHSWSSAGEHV